MHNNMQSRKCLEFLENLWNYCIIFELFQLNIVDKPVESVYNRVYISGYVIKFGSFCIYSNEKIEYF